MKLCKDCKFYYYPIWQKLISFGGEYAKCSRTDPVRGKGEGRFCSTERDPRFEEIGGCGGDAKYFEPR